MTDFKEYHKNPRKITEKQFIQLKKNLLELGDLSGIVHDINTGEIIGGNQRSKVIDIENCEIVIVEQYDEPTATGTVAIGYVVWEGEKLNYRRVDWDEKQCEKANITANKLGGTWDFDILSNEFDFVDLVEEYGFEEWELVGKDEPEKDDQNGEPITAPKEAEQSEEDGYEKDPNTINTDIVEGDLIEIIGDNGAYHRVMCGDSTRTDHVEKLMNGAKAVLMHADPPYGMGKQSDGVANDNLYREQLDAFQLLWISAFLDHLTENASLYIWGNDYELWRLWFRGGLAELDNGNLNVINLIAWVKVYKVENNQPDAVGINSDLMRTYPPATEKALFLMRGIQEMPINSEDYWEGWEPIRSYLEGEAKKMKWKNKKVQELCGVQMYSHWFTKSQFVLIPQDHYETLQAAAQGKAFNKPYDEIAGDSNGIKKEFEKHKQAFFDSRAYFNNTHAPMTDVWQYPRVSGDDRPNHATPKPIATAERAIKTSSPHGAVIVEPFLGSGTTLLAANNTERQLYAMELQPKYVAMSIDRLLKIDNTLTLLRNGEPYELKV